MKRPMYGRYLLKEDHQSKAKTKKVMDGYFQKNSLILPETYNEEICQGCGFRNLRTCKTENYFGQKFCKPCVDDWVGQFIDSNTGLRKA